MTKTEQFAIHNLVETIIHNTLNGKSNYNIIKNLIHQIPKVIIETDYSNLEPKLKQMYNLAIAKANKEIQQKIFSVVGKSETSNRFAEAYSRIKTYILKTLHDLIVNTHDFKTILKSNLQPQTQQPNNQTPAQIVNPNPNQPVKTENFKQFFNKTLILENKLDMTQFKPNEDQRIKNYLGDAKNQAKNFQFIIQTIMKNMNDIFNNNIRTVKTPELKTKLEKINAEIIQKSTNLFNTQLAPNVMPNFLQLTKSEVKEYNKKDDDSMEEKADDDLKRSSLLLDRVLKMVGLENSQSLINKMMSSSVKSVKEEIVQKFKQAKLQPQTIKFISETLNNVAKNQIKSNNALKSKKLETNFNKSALFTIGSGLITGACIIGLVNYGYDYGSAGGHAGVPYFLGIMGAGIVYPFLRTMQSAISLLLFGDEKKLAMKSKEIKTELDQIQKELQELQAKMPKQNPQQQQQNPQQQG